jgi:hypothetical protein
MRVKIRLLAAAPALCLALGLAPALAQTPQPNAGGAAAPVHPPSARDNNPDTPTPGAADMPTYLGMLQKVENDLRQQISRVEQGVRPTQAGAESPDLIHLMQSAREAWQTAQRAPRGFAGTPAHDQAMREMRERFGEVGHGRPTGPASRDIESARAVLRSLEQLRQAASTAQPA